MTRFPPGPKSRYPGGSYFRFRADPLGFLEHVAREFGDVACWKFGLQRVFLINNPDLIRNVLVTHGHNFLTGFERAKDAVGEGILAGDGDLHRSHRQIMQPAFNHERIATFAETITKQTEHASSRLRNGATLNMTDEMMQLTLIVIGKTMFGVSSESEAGEIRDALAGMMGSPSNIILRFGHLAEKLPLPAIRKMKARRARLNQIVCRLVNERRQSEKEGTDLLSMLLLSQDGKGGLTDRQVRDELKTILIAGHETTASALIWTWYLLSEHPAVEARLHEELDRILGNRSPTFNDLRALSYVENVIRESMRLRPPVWMIWRRTISDYQIDGYVAPPRSIVVMSQHVMHRDPRYFSEPLRFDPERWTPEFKAKLPKYAYFPFGGGSRQCLGEGLAWLESILVVATLAQQWKFRRVPGDPIVPEPLLTQRPKGGLFMTALRR